MTFKLYNNKVIWKSKSYQRSKSSFTRSNYCMTKNLTRNLEESAVADDMTILLIQRLSFYIKCLIINNTNKMHRLSQSSVGQNNLLTIINN